MKAADFFTKEKRGKLIFVVVSKKNITAVSIAKNLIPSLKWAVEETNLREVYVIEAASYYANNLVLAFDCEDLRVVH